jgi:hypothetical protein
MKLLEYNLDELRMFDFLLVAVCTTVPALSTLQPCDVRRPQSD